jgi:tetratricopeptide (TPR) repeat protein
MDVSVFRNLMLAHSRTGDVQDALRYGERATQSAPDDAQAWMLYAEVLGNANRVDDALRAFDRVASINPQMPNLAARRSVLLLDIGRVNDAVAAIRTAVQRGELEQEMAERLAQQMAVKGFQLTRDDRLEQAMPYLRAAREAGRSPLTHGMANFFEAWNLIKQGAPTLQAANANAEGARRVRPLFERARTLLEDARAYREQDAQREQLLKQVAQFLEVADALIKAGR